MPGILGLISKKSENNHFSAMLAKLNHYSYKIDSYAKEGVHLGKIHLNYINNKKDNIIISDDGRYIITMIGEIFSYEELETHNIKNDTELLLNIYIKLGTKTLHKINGQYSAVIYDTLEKKLTIISDRYGTRPIYYYSDSSRFIFAPEVKAILEAGINMEQDEIALSHMFNYSHLFGYRTLFKNVKQLPEASYLEYKNGHIKIIKYWDFPENEEAYNLKWPSKKKTDDYIDNLGFVMERAMKRNFTKNNTDILLSLSGGIDSRYVAAFAHKFNIDPKVAFTMGPDFSEDQRYAKKVASKLDIEHYPFEILPENIWNDAKIFSYIADGMSMIYGPIQGFFPLQTFYRKKNITISSQMCDAIFGSNLWRRRLAILKKKKTFDEESKEIIKNIFKLPSDSWLKMLFEKEQFEKISTQYQEIPLQYINKYKIPLHSYNNLLFNEHGRRGTLCGNLMNNLFLETRMPSYDNDVVDFAYNLPIKLKEHQYAYRMAFARLFPELAKIKRENYNLPIDASNILYNYKIQENKAITILKRTFLNQYIKKFPRINKPKYTDYNGWFKKELHTQMSNIIFDKRTLSRGIYKKEGLRKIVSLHTNTNADYSRLLWQVINLEYFYRNFID